MTKKCPKEKNMVEERDKKVNITVMRGKEQQKK
jgi:hypothetical protein